MSFNSIEKNLQSAVYGIQEIVTLRDMVAADKVRVKSL
jgi:hypothetical protein